MLPYNLNLIYCGFNFRTFLSRFYLPETVYWLHANGKIEEAEKILIKAGKINKVEFATPILASPENKTDIENNIYNEDKTFLKEKSFFQRLKIKIQRFSNNFFKKPQNYKTQYSSWELIKNKYLLRNMTFGFVTLLVGRVRVCLCLYNIYKR